MLREGYGQKEVYALRRYDLGLAESMERWENHLDR